MATDDTTSEAVEGSWSPKRPRTAAEQRATRHQGTSDTEVLAQDIEKTREELAETLDAIADKVSPKRVAKRTTKNAKAAAKEGVHDAAEAVKESAQTASEVVKEKTATAAEAVKGAAATVKEKVSGTDDATQVRSPLEPATSVEVGSASPVSGSSPLASGTVSIDAGGLPPAEPAPTTGSLADAADAAGPTVEPAGADLPAYRPLTPSPTPGASKTPVYAGAGAALAVLLLLLRRRRGRRRR